MNKGERTRLQILHQGMKHSAQFGLSDITIGTVSSLCALSRTGVISHFKNKEDMQIAILEYSAQQFVEQVLKPARREDPIEQLYCLFDLWQGWTHRLFDQAQTSCPLIKALVDYQNRPDSAVKAVAVEQQRQILAYLTRLIQRGIDQGRIRPDIHPQALAYELFALNLGHTIAQSTLDPADTRPVFDQSIRARIAAICLN